MNGHAVNEGVGAAQAKTGMQASPLNRGMGYNDTMGSIGSKTRSPHNSAGGPNYLYKDIPTSECDAEIIGQSKGVGGSAGIPAGTH